MPNNQPYGSVTKDLQPEPRIIDNPPARTVAQAVANAKAQVKKAK